MADARSVRRIYQRAASHYDGSGIGRVVDALRARVLREAGGDVLELGVGTGATLGFYPHTVRRLTGLDLSRAMLARAAEEACGLRFPVDLVETDFQTLGFRDASFDVVTSSLALCGVPDPPRLYREISRVLRPGGRLMAIEHVRPQLPGAGLLADLAAPLTERLVGCAFNRRTPEQVREAGFTVRVIGRRWFGTFVAFVGMPRR
jgi:ubiquinone/menaquinone biosynthesis C-methylase UbiE